MAWSDINFDDLVTGAITGPATRSFTVYLNEFAKALDERLNMLIVRPKNDVVNLPNIEFTQYEIRNDQFYDKYHELLSGYFDMWNNYVWYKQSALSNIIDSVDHLYEEEDIRLLIGTDVYDMLENPAAYPRHKIWSAGVLNGLYLLYETLNLSRRGRDRINTNFDDQELNIVNNFRFNNPPTYFGSGAGSGESYGDAVSNYLNSVTQNQSSGSRFPFSITENRAGISTFIGTEGTSYRYSVGTRMTNNSELFYLAKDLLGNTLNMNLYADRLRVANNYIKITENVGSTTNIFIEGPYDPSFPVAEFNNPEGYAEIQPNEILFTSEMGNHLKYYINSDPDDTSLPLFMPPSPGPNDSDDSLRFGRLTFGSLSFTIADLNHPSLEYYIA